jgi:hypothetical protein
VTGGGEQKNAREIITGISLDPKNEYALVNPFIVSGIPLTPSKSKGFY